MPSRVGNWSGLRSRFPSQIGQHTFKPCTEIRPSVDVQMILLSVLPKMSFSIALTPRGDGEIASRLRIKPGSQPQRTSCQLEGNWWRYEMRVPSLKPSLAPLSTSRGQEGRLMWLSFYAASGAMFCAPWLIARSRRCPTASARVVWTSPNPPEARSAGTMHLN